MDTYTVEFVIEADFQLFHGIQDNLERGQYVVEYDRPPFFLFRFGETLGVNQSHLLQHRRLSTLSST